MMKQTDSPMEQMPAIDPARGCCVTIGNFDGVHKGHQALISHAREFARKVGMPCVVVTFWPHPRLVLGREHVPVMTRAARREALQALQPDYIWEIPFNRLVAALSPEEFLRQYLTPLTMRRLVVGHDFSLGKGRVGQPVVLQGLGRAYGYTMEQLAPVMEGGSVVSSSRIRHFVDQGGVDLAARMLGRLHFCDGEVVRGEGRGEGLGFPTANMDLPETLLPPEGVYASRLSVGGTCYAAVTNLGSNPTFGGRKVGVESFVLDAPGDLDLYGRRVRVHFVKQLRRERQFSGPEELAAQIARDVEQARGILPDAQPFIAPADR